MKRKERTKKNGRFSTAASVILVITGIALILYPTVANFINESTNGSVIDEYRKQVELTGADEYEKILGDVREYNEELARLTPYISDLTKEARERYEELLNPTGSGIMGYIEIPKADVYLAIYHGTEESVLQTGVGHLEGSSLPAKGESVHTVLTGHSGLPSARLFTDIDRLKRGDTFTLHVLNEELTYEVDEIKRVEPDTLEDLHIDEGKELCTLVTCTPYGVNTHRLAVTGHRTDTPNTPNEEDRSIDAITSSKWNRIYVFLPPVIFALIVAAVISIRKILKHKHKGRRLHRGKR